MITLCGTRDKTIREMTEEGRRDRLDQIKYRYRACTPKRVDWEIKMKNNRNLQLTLTNDLVK